jgi:replicative DNA helicase|eukprot:GHVU01139632.1.p1 GENE.GHVU01139632.1~~GHVU01139632.1.p1  ORF type:complete len:458 (-),score=52.63 GHVU01139632.1:884-2257(-)
MTLNSINQYGHDFQIKVLSSLLTHKEFLVNIHDIISEEYFENQAQKWAIKEVLNYYDKYHTTPSLDILKVELQKVDNEVLQISIKEQLKQAFVTSDDDLEYVQEEFTNFCKNQQLKKALMSSVDLLKAGDFDGIRFIVDNALKAGQDKNIGHEYAKDIESRYRENSREVVPTPWPRINTLLQGGLGNGDFGLIFGNPGGGKSWSLVSLGGHAVKMGYTVLHYTLELGEDYVGKRYDAFFTKIPVNKVDAHKDQVAELIPQLPGKLIIKEYPTGKATVSTIESHIAKATSMGTKPDLVIIDYVDLLSSRKTNRERKDEIDDIYTSTKGLARQLDIPIWSVSQVNRAGANDNVIQGDKAAGSYDKIMITDFCMSLSRKKEDKVNNTGRFHLMKNRYGMDGITFGIEADTSIGHFTIKNEYDEDDESTTLTPTTRSNKFDTDVDTFDKAQLRKKFFELNP